MFSLSDERKIKMELLKRKSRRKNLIQELNFMNLTEDSFLDIEDNDIFCKKVLSLLNTKSNKIELQGDNYQENIINSIQLLNETIDTIKVILEKRRVLFFRENEIEAVLVNINEVFSPLDDILKLTKFPVG